MAHTQETDFNSDFAPFDQSDPSSDRSLSDFDQRYKVVVAAVLGSRTSIRGCWAVSNFRPSSTTAAIRSTCWRARTSTAEDIERVGGHALPIALDIRFEDAVKAAVQQAVQRFGGIDILVNNASASSLTSTAQTSIKRLDLMLGSGLSRVYGEVGIFTEG